VASPSTPPAPATKSDPAPDKKTENEA
jgi:hypothetical protein